MQMRHRGGAHAVAVGWCPAAASAAWWCSGQHLMPRCQPAPSRCQLACLCAAAVGVLPARRSHDQWAWCLDAPSGQANPPIKRGWGMIRGSALVVLGALVALPAGLALWRLGCAGVAARCSRTMTGSASATSIMRRWLMAPAACSCWRSETMAAAFGAMVRTTGRTEKIRQGIKQRPGEISIGSGEKGGKMPPGYPTSIVVSWSQPQCEQDAVRQRRKGSEG